MAELRDAGPFDRFLLQGPGPYGMALPTTPMRSAPIAGGDALWLGPDEWLLLIAGEGRGEQAVAALGATAPHALVDISHRQVALRLAGADAALLLNGAVPLDLSTTAFPPGMCTRTLFEKAGIVLWRRAAEEWHVETARSFAPYVRALLTMIAAANAIPLTDLLGPA